MSVLPHIITHSSHTNPIKEQDIGKDIWFGVDHADDEKIVRDYSPYKEEYKSWIWQAPALGAMIIFIGVISPRTGPNALFIMCMMAVLSLLASLIAFVYWRWKPDKEVVVFDRIQGTVKFPGGLFRKGPVYVFSDIIAYVGWLKSGPFLAISIERKLLRRAFMQNVHLSSNSCSHEETWSFYVWYMDKNRPLPPGSAFDAYRQKDYERRKAAGFLPPLYPSRIPTPEGCG